MPEGAPVLVLMGNRPRHRAASQAFVSAFGPSLACYLEWRLLECALEDLFCWSGDRILSVDTDETSWAESLVPAAVRLRSDVSPSLGQRIQRVDGDLRSGMDTGIVYVRPGMPALDTRYLEDAADAVARGFIAWGQTNDGGFAVLGTPVAVPDLHALPWDRSSLGERLLRTCRRAGLGVEVLPPVPYIAKPADLPACRIRLADDDRPARQRLHDLLSALTIPASRATLLAAAHVQCPEAGAPTRGT